MATLVLGAVGSAIGSSFGGAILGLSGTVIGGMIGSTIGSAVDSWLVSSLAPAQRIEGARLDSLRITSSSEGAVIPRVYGRMRVGGNIIWATDFREETRTSSQGGGKGGGPKVQTTEYLYFASFAVALCEGPITDIGRIWADGKPLDMVGVVWRWYPGDEEQDPDPFIAAKMGAASTPAYRGTAYVVFEELPLRNFGNRIPQLTFEVFRPLADPDTAEDLTRAVTLIPSAGEFTYATDVVRKVEGGIAVTNPLLTTTVGGTSSTENSNAVADTADIVVALDRLQAMVPSVEAVSLVVSWFGDDLRAGDCRIRPKVEFSEKATPNADWSVNGIARGDAELVSRDSEDRPVYGGTPADFAVVQAIRELKARGMRVTFYPFLMMDVPPGNTLPDPYSDNAGDIGQPAFPWRGRITCSPAAGYEGSVDQTASAATEVASFFGSATPADFSISGETVSWTGPANDWGLRRMILHYAHLCAVAGGVDAFLIGTEMRGLTHIRSGAATYPAVAAFRDLAADVRAILGAGTKISYAADWSEYFGHQPDDGSNDVFFHLDPLWADANIDFIGIDNYMPLSDWRDGFEHADAQTGWPAIHDRAYLQSNIAGGEGFDWFYASSSDRAAQLRTPIEDGSATKPWVFRYKDLRAWWSEPHFNRPGGVESATPTAWVPESKPIWFTELGCPAVDRGTNQPNVFFDPKSSESFVPYFSRGWRDDAIQRAYLEGSYLWWGDAANNPTSSVYGDRMVHVPECAAWTWDARPYPFFPALTDVWTDGPNWRLGHWLTGRLGAVSLAALVRHLCLRAGLPEERIDVSGLWGAVEGYVIGALESPRSSIATLARHFGFDATETGGVIRFIMRGRAAVTVISSDDMVAIGAGESGTDIMELTRAQETELPQALKWQVARADEDYDAAQVEAQRITVDTTRIALESFAMAIPPEEAERRCRRALMEAWSGRETAMFRLPPSRLALDPCDVIALDHDGRQVDMRLVSVADSTFRSFEALRQDRANYDLPPGNPRPATLATPMVFGAPDVLFLDLPQLREEIAAHRPLIAAHARPWPGELAVYRSPANDGFDLLTTFGRRARMGVLVADFYAGPTSRFDFGNDLFIDLFSGTLESVTDIALLGGANALALETGAGQWEIVQAGSAELIAPGRYCLTRLLRGQRGTEAAMGNPTLEGARVVILDDSLTTLPISEADLGLPWNWRIGPAARPPSDESYVAASFTPDGVGLRPFSVAHIDQPWRRPRGLGDLTIRWVRRSRALAADNWGMGDVALAEEAEAYALDILDGSTVKRTLSTNTAGAVYSGTDQITDWGALLGPGDTLTIRIAQLSALIGRGAARTVTLFF
ncbi:glycoside hydrolase/phage tail family protein [Roseibaca sp. V10]|uniref:Glycoside hydrolase/phage tail family protein n=1 Tax=Roseinatronobacter domitianus TaxID=2940293 RepID=A0ABT0M4W4_9RHOB|nr:glycoside hydrolase TIM-barrel-like domain-containing protein [Roseibaca domitiana]MCL1629896.1 glycoside hydrolase/phage tail family protein [Roseibaca domitiana]